MTSLLNFGSTWQAGTPLLHRAVAPRGRADNLPIDPDTPKTAHAKKGQDGREYWLVFSDEFNADGRTFDEGDDPYWTAADMWYHATGDLEYYDPKQITTKDGYLTITLEEAADPEANHGLKYVSGMLTGWNKMCFTGGILEASISLPGCPDISGLWPGFWTMGNLARPSYGATTEGMWPYSYDTCDSGTLLNQSNKDTGIAPKTGDGEFLSHLPGQRLSACTCPGEDHPGPSPDVGRSAPELDVFEALVNKDGKFGEISQSLQIAPFDPERQWDNSTDNYYVGADFESHINEWKGGPYQQCISCLSRTDQVSYENVEKDSWQTYGVEFTPSHGRNADGYVYWTQNEKVTFHLEEVALGPRADVDIGQRLIPREPMYTILNLGMSESFGKISENLKLPVKMRVDWVRVYQEKDSINANCSPKNFPTAKYIERHMDAYTNATMRRWKDHEPRGFPQNRLRGGCADDTIPN